MPTEVAAGEDPRLVKPKARLKDDCGRGASPFRSALIDPDVWLAPTPRYADIQPPQGKQLTAPPVRSSRSKATQICGKYLTFFAYFATFDYDIAAYDRKRPIRVAA